jgi:hypothetical protein
MQLESLKLNGSLIKGSQNSIYVHHFFELCELDF